MAHIAEADVVGRVEAGLGAKVPVGEAAERALDDLETLAPWGLARHGTAHITPLVGRHAPG